MKRKRLRPFVVPVFSAMIFSVLILTFVSFNNSSSKEEIIDYDYVTESIIDNSVPVFAEESVITKPFQNENIEIYKQFYDGNSNTENAIIYYNGTYMQNSGIIYNSNENFSVVSILDGEVIDVRKDDLLGYVVDIKHNDRITSSYQGLKSVNVIKGDHVLQNTIIGSSGEITLDVNLNNSLLFELIIDGKYVNPENYYNKSINEV